ncbi:MAG: DNRLRE domain-containing protein [Candidatus Gastranaerophilales bacterium]|nr:DNRLRE domain-containing protein [Candidatus Gastranaerophilales bacterium]
MNILIKFTKLLFLLCLTISLMSTSAQAANLTLYATDDLSIKLNATSPLNTSYDYTTSVGETTKMISYLKFDISSLSGLDINTVKLTMYGNIDPDSDVTTNKIGIYYVNNDSWSETSTFSWANRPTYDDTNLIASASHSVDVDSYNSVLYAWRLSPSADISSGVLAAEISDGTLSLAIQDISSVLSSDISKTVFISNNNSSVLDAYKPQLLIQYTPPPTPAPEPSSVILGMLSLGGLLGFKRKRK